LGFRFHGFGFRVDVFTRSDNNSDVDRDEIRHLGDNRWGVSSAETLGVEGLRFRD
jgi:hypothetical protein